MRYDAVPWWPICRCRANGVRYRDEGDLIVKTQNIFRLLLGLSISIHFWVTPVAAQEVIVLGGPEEGMQWLTAERWWGEEERGEQLSVPRAIITGINPS